VIESSRFAIDTECAHGHYSWKSTLVILQHTLQAIISALEEISCSQRSDWNGQDEVVIHEYSSLIRGATRVGDISIGSEAWVVPEEIGYVFQDINSGTALVGLLDVVIAYPLLQVLRALTQDFEEVDPHLSNYGNSLARVIGNDIGSNVLEWSNPTALFEHLPLLTEGSFVAYVLLSRRSPYWMRDAEAWLVISRFLSHLLCLQTTGINGDLNRIKHGWSPVQCFKLNELERVAPLRIAGLINLFPSYTSRWRYDILLASRKNARRSWTAFLKRVSKNDPDPMVRWVAFDILCSSKVTWIQDVPWLIESVEDTTLPTLWRRSAFIGLTRLAHKTKNQTLKEAILSRLEMVIQSDAMHNPTEFFYGIDPRSDKSIKQISPYPRYHVHYDPELFG